MPHAQYPMPETSVNDAYVIITREIPIYQTQLLLRRGADGELKEVLKQLS
jgi:hypothetical protein